MPGRFGYLDFNEPRGGFALMRFLYAREKGKAATAWREKCSMGTPEDVARLSPIGHEHVNVYGKYSFQLSESIQQGAFHPLRELDETESLEGGSRGRAAYRGYRDQPRSLAYVFVPLFLRCRQ